MLTFKQRDQIPKARLPTHLAAYIDQLFADILKAIPNFNPDNDGHIVLITPKDSDENLCKGLGSRYADNAFEGVTYNSEFRCWNAVTLANNQFVITIVVPCEAWLDTAIRARMVQVTA